MAKTILLVDDDRNLVALMGRKLEAEGYTVLTAADGRDGLTKARTGGPDLVLLDLVMPGMNGFEVLKGLKASPETAQVPVVMLTTQGDRKSIFEAERLGAADFVVKGGDWTELMRTVQKHT